MFSHHPALVETGELEVAQRQALHEAVEAARLGTFDSGDDQVRASVAAYLAEMRRQWQPDVIEIAEGDHIIVGIDGQRAKIAHELDSAGDPWLSLDDGDEVHYPANRV